MAATVAKVIEQFKADVGRVLAPGVERLAGDRLVRLPEPFTRFQRNRPKLAGLVQTLSRQNAARSSAPPENKAPSEGKAQ
jgi:hypothetical protein